MLERPVHELCVLADDAYRRSANAGERAGCRRRKIVARRPMTALRDVGIALKAALLEDRVARRVQRTPGAAARATPGPGRVSSGSEPVGHLRRTRTCTKRPADTRRSRAPSACTRARRARSARSGPGRLSSSKPISRPTAMRPSELRFFSQRSVPWKNRPATRSAAGVRDHRLLALRVREHRQLGDAVVEASPCATSCARSSSSRAPPSGPLLAPARAGRDCPSASANQEATSASSCSFSDQVARVTSKLRAIGQSGR